MHLPVEPGTYTITARVEGPNDQGFASDTLVIRPTAPPPPPSDPP